MDKIGWWLGFEHKGVNAPGSDLTLRAPGVNAAADIPAQNSTDRTPEKRALVRRQIHIGLEPEMKCVFFDERKHNRLLPIFCSRNESIKYKQNST